MNKSSPSSQGAVSEKNEQPSVMGGCNNYSSKKIWKEDEEMDLGKVEGKGYFQGTFTRDPDSKFRKIVQRVEEISVPEDFSAEENAEKAEEEQREVEDNSLED